MDNTSLAWLKEDKRYQKCPYCKKGNLSERVKSFRLYKLIPFVKVKRYRCDNCDKTIHLFIKNK